MESRNLVTRDENNIVRDAQVALGFVADGAKYVVYVIPRNNEQDNVLVSKLVDNNDKTSTMVNIEDKYERAKIFEMVKDLVTYALRNEKDYADSEVELPGGNKIKIVDVLFNKEQNINVSETYVISPTKALSKVFKDFYNIPGVKKEDLEGTKVIEPIVEPETSNIEDALMMEMPELNLEPPVEEPNEEEIQKTTDELEIPEELKVNEEPKIEPTELEIPAVEVPKEEPTNEISEPEVVPPTVVEEKKEEPLFEIPKEETIDKILAEPNPEPIKEPEPITIPVPDVPVSVEPPVVQEEPLQVEESVASVDIPKLEEPTPAEVLPEQPVPIVTPPVLEPVTPEVNLSPTIPEEQPADKLFFDGSNESNLNKALDEVSDDKIVAAPLEGVNSLREFGVEEPVPPLGETAVQEDVKKLTRSKGFANNKFFMAIAIIFFILACIFLGYEAFQYFSLK